ncbi:MAG: PEP/pyruvate-binding domain-containing protein [Myxococcaceae bacterium]
MPAADSETQSLADGFDSPKQTNEVVLGGPLMGMPANEVFSPRPVANLFDNARAAVQNITQLANRGAYDSMARAGEGAGRAGMPELKFLLDRKTGRVHFIPKQFDYHYTYARDGLGVNMTAQEFTRAAYLNPNRRYVPGTLTAFDNLDRGNGRQGGYSISFWSTDIVRAPMIKEVYQGLQTAMPFAAKDLFFRPGGESQERLLDQNNSEDRKVLQNAGIEILTNAELAESFSFSALNPGVSFGRLRFIHGDGTSEASPTRREVVIYADEIPAELPPVAGLATPQPQTYLSHVALKARQDKTPYAYARDILNDPKVQSLEGKIVRFEVTPTGYKIREATQQEADAHLEKLRPPRTQVLQPDLSVKEASELGQLGFGSARAYGSKSSNVAELLKLSQSGKLDVSNAANGEPEVITPDGFGLPASWYDSFFKTAKYDAQNTFEQRLTQMLADPGFKDPATRSAMLKDFREQMEQAALPPALDGKLQALLTKFKAKFPGEDLRIRSSSSSEDLKGFSGAGLFDSYTFRMANENRPGRTLPDRLKKVFASVWNDRAFEEFDFYRIDPHSVVMSELVTPNEENEIANGVVRWGGAIPGWDTMTVNAQVGEKLVTNPEGNSKPDAFIVGNYGFNGEPEIQYEQTTNEPLPAGRKHVLTSGEVLALYKAMQVIQKHFKAKYSGDESFNIECEFKVTSDGKLLIKQARPWVQ